MGSIPGESINLKLKESGYLYLSCHLPDNHPFHMVVCVCLCVCVCVCVCMCVCVCVMSCISVCFSYVLGHLEYIFNMIVLELKVGGCSYLSFYLP